MVHRTIPIDELRALVSYDPASGTLMRLRRPIELFAGKWRVRNCTRWNNTYADKPITVKHHGGYVILNIKHAGKAISLLGHRVALALHCGEWPEGEVDHINGDRSDNRLCNLRIVRRLDNNRNKRLQANNTTGFSGISWDGSRGKWVAEIGGRGNRRFLGRFTSFDDAIAARKIAQAALGYHPNHGRGSVVPSHTEVL